MQAKYRFFLLASAVAAAALAAPAPWYKWRSKLNGTVICTQVMHGAWERFEGPFTDAQCERPGKPG